MRVMLLGFAAAVAALSAAPALAGSRPDIPFVGVPNAKGTVGTLGGPGFVGGVGHPGFGGGYGHPGYGGGFGGYDRGHGGYGYASSNGIWVNSGQWALYNNETFKSASYNDWWHDRPDRAYPAWMRSNQRCERLWYSGATLRC